MKIPTEEERKQFRELLMYDPETGIVKWRVRRNGVKPDLRAGNIENLGYRVIKVNGKIYKEHRIAWFLQTGDWPTLDIDHIDNDRTNNKFANLRLATRSQNSGNQRLRNRSESGKKGVTRHTQSGKWVANIRVNNKLIYLGIYETIDAAAQAYEKAAREHFGEYANGA